MILFYFFLSSMGGQWLLTLFPFLFILLKLLFLSSIFYKQWLFTLFPLLFLLIHLLLINFDFKVQNRHKNSKYTFCNGG